MFLLVSKNKRPKNDHRKMCPKDLDSPRQELSNGGLGIVVTLLVRWQIDFFVYVSLIGKPTVWSLFVVSTNWYIRRMQTNSFILCPLSTNKHYLKWNYLDQNWTHIKETQCITYRSQERTERATTNPRPRTEKSQQGVFRYTMPIFVWSMLTSFSK